MRTNEIFKSKKITILMAVAIMSAFCYGIAFAQNTRFYPADSKEAIKILGAPPAKSLFRDSNVPPAEFYGGYGIPLIRPLKFIQYSGNNLQYMQVMYVNGSDITNPYVFDVGITVNTPPVDIVYSLYTYKSTFPQDGKRVRPGIDSPSMQAIQECGTVTPLSTQVDIDNDLDKIYEFAPITETATGMRELQWDGKTSDGKVVRDCLYLAAHEKGNLIGLKPTGSIEGYQMSTSPGVEYTAGPTSVSAKITVAYEKPVRRIWAILATAGCTTGSEFVTYGVVNQGGSAIAAGMNKKSPGSALAVTELKNPVLDQNGLVKIFTWDNITGLDGKPVLPPDQNTQYMLLIDVEGDDGQGKVIPTVTGLNDGYLTPSGTFVTFPMPWSYTGIQNPAADDKIVVETTPDGFIINPKGNFNGEWMLTSTAGVKLTVGKGSFVSKSGLPKGVYFLTVSNPQGVKETHKVIVR